jgi:hypothetical protein
MLQNRFIALFQEKYATIFFIVLLLALTYFLYLPGLIGFFMLDDYQNLHGLEFIKDPYLAKRVADYVLNGISGPLGRPVSLLSFALQHDAWPRDPRAFKQVNLVLHMLNGILLYWLLVKLCTHLALSRAEAAWVSLVTVGIWLVHPIQVSTVLYVVQRMNELCALFTLASLIAYLRGRERLLRRDSVLGYVWLSAVIVLGGLLATLSKENGLLLLVFVLVLEVTLLSELPKPRYWREWSALFLYMPLMLLSIYFVINSDKILAGYEGQRNFDLVGRLLTEGRVLLNYIVKIFVPHPSAFGVMFDDYSPSRGLFDPATTLPSIALLSLLLFCALKYRRKMPVLSFGILWFFCGHLLESTFIPLELYFEHRNYLPLFGLLFPVAYYATKATGPLRVVVVTSGLIMLVSVATITWNETQLWGNPYKQAAIWAMEKPFSNRAQEYLAGAWRAEHNNFEAVKVYRRMAELHPQDARGLMDWLELGCRDANLPVPDTQKVFARLKISEFSYVPIGMLLDITEMREKTQCQRLKHGDLQQMVSGLLQNSRFRFQEKNLYLLQARLYASEGQLDPAIKAMDRAYALAPTVDDALTQARWLASAGLYDDALSYVQKARELANQSFIRRYLYEGDVDAWERALLEARKEEQSSPRPQ